MTLKELYAFPIYEYYLLIEDSILSANANSPILDNDI